MAEAKQLVQEFCDLMAARDAEALRPYLDSDVVYHNAGTPPTAGVDAVVENVAGQMANIDCYEYEMVNIVAEGDTVMTERLDYIRGADGNTHGVPVMGTFVVRDGRIARWTDYFDFGLVHKMASGEDYSKAAIFNNGGKPRG